MRATLCGLLPALVLLSAATGGSQITSQVHDFFRPHVGLNEQQIASITDGVAVAKVISADDRATIEIFGAVFVKSTPERYVARATNVEALASMPGYLAAGRLGTPPSLADLGDLALGQDDMKELRDCKPGDCDIQLPAAGIEEFRKAVDWSAPDATARATALARQMVLDAVVAYQRGGNAALGTYRDKKHPVRVGDEFARLIKTFASLPIYFPDFERYLLDYPSSPLSGAENVFYWETVDFGLKPTFRIIHAITHRPANRGDVTVLALKQLYASHYFETAIDLTVCVPDPDRQGFYLITLKASTQAGLTGLKGSIVRKVAVGRTRSSLEQGLATMKAELER